MVCAYIQKHCYEHFVDCFVSCIYNKSFLKNMLLIFDIILKSE